MLSVWNLANFFTALRIALTPVAVGFILTGHWRWALLTVFVAGMTDGLDGFAARNLDSRTSFGEKFDPIADKILLVSLFIALTFSPDGRVSIPLWLTFVVIARDVFISAGALFIYTCRGVKRFPPTFLGKVSTTMQMLTVGAVLVQGAFFDLGVFLALILALTLLATVLSGIDYLWNGILLWRSAPEGKDQ